jgi:hypothetical protein
VAERWPLGGDAREFGFLRLVLCAGVFSGKDGRQGIHEQERMYLNAAIETRRDLTPDFSKGVSKPLNDWLPHRTDGIVRPLWPWLAAWSVAADHAPATASLSAEDHRVLRSGKRWLFGLSLGFLLMLGLAAARAFSVPAAC